MISGPGTDIGKIVLHDPLPGRLGKFLNILYGAIETEKNIRANIRLYIKIGDNDTQYE